MEIKYLKETDILLIKLREEAVYESEVSEFDRAVIDYGIDNKVISIKILDWEKRIKQGETIEVDVDI